MLTFHEILKRLTYAKPCCVVTPRDAVNDIQTSNKPLGASTIMDCTQVLLRCTQPDHRPWGAMCGRGMPASRTMPQWCHAVTEQLASLALLLLHDQGYKAWCHGGHGRSCVVHLRSVHTFALTPLSHIATACYGGFDEGLCGANFAQCW